MSTKFPNDGLTDAELAAEEAEAAKIPDGLGPLEDYTRYTKDDKPGSSELSVARTSEVAAKDDSPGSLDRALFGLLGGKVQLDHHLAVDHKLTVDMQGWGGLTRPLHVSHHGIPDSSPITDPGIRHADRTLTTMQGFEGTFNSEIIDGRLMIPAKYTYPLHEGGVITAGMGRYLMLFGRQHWSRMMNMLGDQVGLNLDKNILVKHIYGRHQKFELLYDKSDRKKQSPFMLLRKDLIDYAALGKDIVMVGMMYHAEVYNPEAYKESLLDSQTAEKHTRSLSQA